MQCVWNEMLSRGWRGDAAGERTDTGMGRAVLFRDVALDKMLIFYMFFNK